MGPRRIALLLLAVGLGGCGAVDPAAEAGAAAARGHRARAAGRAEGRVVARRGRRRGAAPGAPACRDPQGARGPHGRGSAAAGAAHRPISRRPAHARLTRDYAGRPQRAGRLTGDPRRRARLRGRDRRLARRAAAARPRAGCSPCSSCSAATREFWTHAAMPAAAQRTTFGARSGGVPVLPRPRDAAPAAGELGQGELAGGRVHAGAREGAPPRRLPGRRAAPERRPAARARRPPR